MGDKKLQRTVNPQYISLMGAIILVCAGFVWMAMELSRPQEPTELLCTIYQCVWQDPQSEHLFTMEGIVPDKLDYCTRSINVNGTSYQPLDPGEYAYCVPCESLYWWNETYATSEFLC